MLSSLLNIDLSNFFLVIKILSGIASILFVAGIIYFLLELVKAQEESGKKKSEHFFVPIQEKNQESERWEKIVDLFSSNDSNNWRIAIIDADTMLEDCMHSLGYSGTTMGDMMKQMQDVYWIQSAWDVHLLRNKLAHEGSRYHLTEREAYRAFRIYQNIFFDTGYIKNND